MPPPITQKNLPSIVQFPHPGPEAKPDKNSDDKKWSTINVNHTRKFALNEGKYMCDINSEPIASNDMMFWCEWEPESTVINTFTKTSAEHPQYLYELWWQSKKNYRGLHNTDPFIFEQPFKYYNCRQDKRPSLTKLTLGSLILFGSQLNGQFVLDTVFVVGKKVPYTTATYSSDLTKAGVLVSTCFDSVCMHPTTVPPVATLYEGVQWNQRNEYNGMFSFFPCLPHEDNMGFARPAITLSGIISNKSGRNIKNTDNVSNTDCVEVWNEVVRQVTAQGLCLGIEATTPPQKHSNLPPKPNSQPFTSSTKC